MCFDSIMNSLSARRWSLAEWMNSEGAWTDLLTRSEVDGLFLSWDWLTEWWRCFGNSPGSVPNVLGVYRGERLVGLAPFYRRLAMRGSLVPVRSVQLIGLSWRDSSALISEYLDVIARREDEQAVRLACLHAIVQDGAWGELVIGSTAASAQWREALVRVGLAKRCYVRELDRSVAYQADLTQGFLGYLGALGQSTRRSVWNLRKRLATYGEVRVEYLAASEIAGGFADLNRLHHMRWDRPAFAGKRLSFHTNLASRLASRGELALSRLRVGGKAVSVLYDIRKGARQYNVKMGFDPAFSGRLSLGLIHLGYAIEEAAHQRVSVYDFLAGPGQTTDYKRHLSQTHRDLSSVQMLRGRLLTSLYRWRDRAR
jgi:CelD/BcsL family acetyltransferase involved in cellulose biosynthesis